jgi:hypothetical protein
MRNAVNRASRPTGLAKRPTSPLVSPPTGRGRAKGIPHSAQRGTACPRAGRHLRTSKEVSTTGRSQAWVAEALAGRARSSENKAFVPIGVQVARAEAVAWHGAVPTV